MRRVGERVARSYVQMGVVAGVVVLCAYLLFAGFDVFRPEVVTAAGAVLTALGLAYTAVQVRLSRITAGSEFVLKMYEMMQKGNPVHVRLMAGGDWSQSDGPKTDDEWMNVDRYMALFEPIQIFLVGSLVHLRMVDVMYSHRVIAIVRNPDIVRRNLIGRKYRWKNFIDLWMILREQETFLAICEREGYKDEEAKHAAEVGASAAMP